MAEVCSDSLCREGPVTWLGLALGCQLRLDFVEVYAGPACLAWGLGPPTGHKGKLAGKDFLQKRYPNMTLPDLRLLGCKAGD